MQASLSLSLFSSAHCALAELSSHTHTHTPFCGQLLPRHQPCRLAAGLLGTPSLLCEKAADGISLHQGERA